MTILYITLIFAFNTGLVYHEIVGLSIFVFFIFHIILNWSWVKNVTKNLFNKKVKTSIKLKYVLNFSLLIGILIISVTGILISQVVIPLELTINKLPLIALHKWSSYICIGLFSLHIALHWQYIVRSISKIISNWRERNIKNTILRVGAATLIVCILYSQIIFSVTKASENKISLTNQQFLNPTQDITDQSSQKSDGNGKSFKEDSISNAAIDQEDNLIAEDTLPITLSEFLNSMYCTGCSKHCSLLYPQCSKALPQIEAAKIQYENLYGEENK